MINKEKYDYERDREGIKRHKQCVSSFIILDPEVVFKELGLKKGDCFLDLGCGRGDYSLEASKHVGETGIVYALDKWEEVTGRFREEVNSRGIGNVKVTASDILCPLPVRTGSIDVCLLATVLHIPNISRAAGKLFDEVYRVLKTDGRLAVINIKKEEMSFGPPMAMRLSMGDTRALVMPRGFEEKGFIDLGYTYMIQFGKDEKSVQERS